MIFDRQSKKYPSLLMILYEIWIKTCNKFRRKYNMTSSLKYTNIRVIRYGKLGNTTSGRKKRKLLNPSIIRKMWKRLDLWIYVLAIPTLRIAVVPKNSSIYTFNYSIDKLKRKNSLKPKKLNRHSKAHIQEIMSRQKLMNSWETQVSLWLIDKIL